SLLAARALARVREALGADLPLRALFEAPTPAALAQVAEAANQDVALPPLRPIPRGGELPLSFAQERLWFLDQLAPGGSAYSIPVAVRLRGSLDVGRLGRSLSEIARRHEILRSSFPVAQGRPVLRIAPVLPLDPARVDLTGLPAGWEDEVARLIGEEAVRPFDLERGPLARAALLRLAADEHVLLLSLHHTVADGGSIEILLRELGALYREAPLPELPVQYADFAAWQRSWLSGASLDTQIAWWCEHLDGAPAVLDLPADRPRPPVPSQRGGVRPLRIPAEVTRELSALGRREGATLFMVVLAGLEALLHRYTGRDDLVVGAPVAGRDSRETEGLIGLFVNTLALRVRLDAAAPVRGLLAQVRQTLLAAHAHRHVPFEKVVEELRPGRDLSHAPIFQVLLTFQAHSIAPGLPGVELEPVASEVRTAKLDLTIGLAEGPDGLTGALEFNRDLFDPATAVRMAGHLENLLRGIAAAPGERVAALPLLGEAERLQVAVEWNERPALAPADFCLHEIFRLQAARTPDAVALYDGDQRLTYAELARRSGCLAARLRELGVGPEVRVGVFLQRSADLVVGLLGILQAGGAYVPLDPAYPAERVAFMLEDAGASAVLVHESLRERLPAEAADLPVVVLDTEKLTGEDEPPPSGVLPENLAYLIYTSGSTGRPKAVAIQHASAAALLRWAEEAFSDEELAGVLAATSISFDLSVFELFVPLSRGGAVVMAENALALPALPERDRVTLVNTVPSAMAHLVQTGGVPASVGTVNLAGEPLPSALAGRVYQTGTVRRLMNLYGPSEDTTYSTEAFVVPGDRREPTIGRPLPGTWGYVLDASGELAPAGAPGELLLGGAGLARGYLGRPELTAERFVPDPFSGVPGARLYRTGDLTRRLPEGELQYLGR
ncbi:MAG TPA: amino acid adenylation domain-containing protein, partial [Thermoanaerobaculia bacterium]|nr:amino acid adenylation domain-containing protein [Thermoanaerobaculia bacterium]